MPECLSAFGFQFATNDVDQNLASTPEAKSFEASAHPMLRPDLHQVAPFSFLATRSLRIHRSSPACWQSILPSHLYSIY